MQRDLLVYEMDKLYPTPSKLKVLIVVTSQALFGLLTVLTPLNSYAEPSPVHGHIKYQLSDFRQSDSSDFFGANESSQSFDARIYTNPHYGNFEVRVDAQALGFFGNKSPAQLAIPSKDLQFLPSDGRRLARLSHTIRAEERSETALRLDRAFIGYAKDDLVVRFGREAITWGNGFVFQAIDPFNPFAPTAIDRDYKIGDDMLYLQKSFASGQDLQVAVIPRRDLSSERVEASESSFASKLHGNLSQLELDYDLLIARHYNENMLGFGLTKSIFDAIARLNSGIVQDEQGSLRSSTLFNLDRSFDALGKNAYYFLELYHSDFGEIKSNYDKPSTGLIARITRGELFTLGRDYFAFGGRLEADPRLNIFLSDILNLHDSSSVAQLRVVFDWLENSNLTAGLNFPMGTQSSEYGGPSIPGTRNSIQPLAELYARISWFF